MCGEVYILPRIARADLSKAWARQTGKTQMPLTLRNTPLNISVTWEYIYSHVTHARRACRKETRINGMTGLQESSRK
jgi:hypothetical protein